EGQKAKSKAAIAKKGAFDRNWVPEYEDVLKALRHAHREEQNHMKLSVERRREVVDPWTQLFAKTMAKEMAEKKAYLKSKLKQDRASSPEKRQKRDTLGAGSSAEENIDMMEAGLTSDLVKGDKARLFNMMGKGEAVAGGEAYAKSKNSNASKLGLDEDALGD
ncbi:unnamed protein product, partial [Amoebophrya sp. A25]